MAHVILNGVIVDNLADLRYQIAKAAFGAEGTVTPVSATNPLPVTGIDSFGAITNAISGISAEIITNADTAIIAAQAAGIKVYITSIMVTNSHATVGTRVQIWDGPSASGVLKWSGWAAAGGGGWSHTFATPIPCTAATAVNAKCVTTGATVIVGVSGYIAT
jgi:hypothetical protein